MYSVVSIHQPNFIPWLGYFYKIANSDSFIILDDVDIVLGSASAITHRTKIQTKEGAHWLSIPLIKGESKKICDIRIDNSTLWREKHLSIINQAYRKAINFPQAFSWIEKMYSNKSEFLSVFNISILEEICRILKVNTPLFVSSTFQLCAKEKNDRIIELVQHVNGNVYLSGNGAKKYNDEEKFRLSNIKLEYTEFIHPIYQQLNEPFIPGLSVIDYLMNNEEFYLLKT